MLYIDYDYKIDCENKINYQKMKLLDESNTDLINIINSNIDVNDAEKIYADYANKQFAQGNIVLIVKAANDNFWVKNVDLCKEIAPYIFKIVILQPKSLNKTIKKV